MLSVLTLTAEQRETLKGLAEVLASRESGKSPKSQMDFYLMMLNGLEIGLDPLQAVEFHSLIHGKVSLSGAGMLALVNKHDLLTNMRIIESTDQQATIEMTRREFAPMTITFTMNEAEEQNLPSQNRNWGIMPAVMLRWRAVSALCRLLFPDAIGGSRYTPDELNGDDAPSDWPTAIPNGLSNQADNDLADTTPIGGDKEPGFPDVGDGGPPPPRQNAAQPPNNAEPAGFVPTAAQRSALVRQVAKDGFFIDHPTEFIAGQLAVMLGLETWTDKQAWAMCGFIDMDDITDHIDDALMAAQQEAETEDTND